MIELWISKLHLLITILLRFFLLNENYYKLINFFHNFQIFIKSKSNIQYHLYIIVTNV